MKKLLLISVLLFANSMFCQKYDYVNLYPFSKSTSIVLATFHDLKPRKTNDTLAITVCQNIPKINNKVNFGDLDKTTKLYASDYLKLAEVIFEKPSKQLDIFNENDFCNEEGYAILFFDELGNVFEYIQFCYNCRTTLSSFKESKFKNGDYEKFSLLKDIFKSNGIEIKVYRN